jgi:YHS domain-containing protein
MSADHQLSQRIEAELRVAEERIGQIQQQALARFEDLERRSARFREIAEPFAHQVIVSRLQKLLDYFKNGQLAEVDERSGYHCTCSFMHTARFPATVKLTLGVTHDERLERLLLTYNLDISPRFLQYDQTNLVDYAFDAFDPAEATRWIDDRIVQFVQTYLQLEFADQYQQENLVTDPVGNERFSRIYAAAQMDHQGNTYYFVTEENKKRFAEKPELYVAANHAR